jgi:hypothetical protein
MTMREIIRLLDEQIANVARTYTLSRGSRSGNETFSAKYKGNTPETKSPKIIAKA